MERGRGQNLHRSVHAGPACPAAENARKGPRPEGKSLRTDVQKVHVTRTWDQVPGIAYRTTVAFGGVALPAGLSDTSSSLDCGMRGVD